MSDVLSPAQRSHCMSRIRSANTTPELRLRRALWAAGLRYRIRSDLPGKPDLVFPGARIALFVDGCFWHRCPVHSADPKTNAEFWRRKLESNVARDRKVDQVLADMGWRVLRFWEHEVRGELDRVVAAVRDAKEQ
jgi:DNA mismatch endonuclease, patch repair protein